MVKDLDDAPENIQELILDLFMDTDILLKKIKQNVRKRV
jgi:hypothetical protein